MCSPRIIPGDGAYSVCTSHRYWANTLLIELRLAFPLLCSQIQITDNCIYRVAFRIQVSMKQVSLLHLEETQESTLINTTALPLLHAISSHAALSLWVAVLYLYHTPVINISGILSALSRSCIWQCASAVLCLTVYLYCLWYPALVGQILHFAWLRLTIPLSVFSPVSYSDSHLKHALLQCLTQFPAERVSIPVSVTVSSCLSLLFSVSLWLKLSCILSCTVSDCDLLSFRYSVILSMLHWQGCPSYAVWDWLGIPSIAGVSCSVWLWQSPVQSTMKNRSSSGCKNIETYYLFLLVFLRLKYTYM